MKSVEDLVLNLAYVADESRQGKKESSDNLAEARNQSAKIDDLEKRITLLCASSGVELHLEKPSESRARSPLIRDARPPSWEELCERARRRFSDRQVDLSGFKIEQLLDQDEVERIDRRFRGGFQLEAKLDRFDIIASIAAGLVASVIDIFLVQTPPHTGALGSLGSAGSPFTKWLNSLNVPHDNWLARYFKTSFDLVKTPKKIAGFSPRTHRLQTFGHDPLLGLIVGTIDIMRGGLSAISKDGKLILISKTGDPIFNPFVAIFYQIGHVLSDCATKMGVPAPGFSLAQVLQFGNFGENQRTIADLARFMYLKGYDSRHFLTMSTSVAAIEIVLRAYFAVRRKLDSEYESEAIHLERVCGSQSVSDHPTFQAMALTSHTIATAANAGKVAIYGGSPLAINYPQWLTFIKSAMAFVRGRLRSPSEVLAAHAMANLVELDEGWPLIEVDDPTFPVLVTGLSP